MISEYTTNDYSKILNVINDAASKYRGIIPDDCWHEPYMPKHELEDEFKNGVRMFGYHDNNELIGCGALKFLEKNHGEFKSIRIADQYRG